ncbi:MAG: DUF3131 domain-containing protein [Pseudotabrizicola sp.]|uniref:DUF3131 domain-containing protein n=1 Tax=Pseudotabrizicola sp. TaxID=2939647 RepID=UPI0027300777|nr:DUF3131 domain-containing protein [Pseudotabrizicola sp.]MDP2081166.1 DUF3131 domain-containing protein [Pseudotabrizicola sp.]MDZ7573105.1 DUF3131 domain-containing protein [Pseudotabrizicola sp.]
MVVLSDIGAETSLAGLEAVLDALLTQAVPCVCVIDPAISTDAPLMPDDPRAVLLRRVWTDYPGLIEVAPFVPDLEGQRPYFQARLASLALIQLVETLDLTQHIRAGRRISTLACRGGAQRVNLDGLRSAGVRTILSLPQVSVLPLRNRVSPSNVLTVSGGRRVSFLESADQLLDPPEPQSHNVLVFSATDFAVPSVQSLSIAAARFARAASEKELRGKGTLTQARDILVRDGTTFGRKIALHLCNAPSGWPTAAAGIAEFVAMLKNAGIAHSTSAPPHAGLDAASVGFRVTGTKEPMPVHLPYAPPTETATTPSPGITVILGRTNSAWRGLDDAGNLHMPLTLDVAEPLQEGALARALGPLDDGVVLIHPAGVTTQAQRLSVLRALLQLDGNGVTNITSLADLVATVMPPDPLLPTFQKTEVVSPSFLRRSGKVSQADRTLLMQDAQAAWSYFERHTDRRTGLCLAAFSGSGSNASQYDRLTNWDIGSHINALIAAADLGLIDKDGFTARTQAVLRNIKGRKILGLLLPPEEVIVGTGRTTRNFNASDTGRLLASLANLAQHPYADQTEIKALVATWDLAGVVVNGSLHSIVRGTLVPADGSQYTDYSARGMATWGIATSTPYAGFTERYSADQKMAFLSTLSQLGPFGTEPALLQALDHGLDVASGYLADTLFTAMLIQYQQDGRLLCPSETPINRSPWFTYQGLQLGESEQPWRILVDKDGKSIDTSADQSQLAISCKAAYLWAAVIEHPHSSRLLRYVREKAREQFGFASCIFVETGMPTSNNSDINTNGIILQSVAAIVMDKSLDRP